MFNKINEKIRHYETMVEVNEEIIANRREEIKATTSEYMQDLYKSTIRAMQAQIDVYYQVIKDLKEIQEEAYTEE